MAFAILLLIACGLLLAKRSRRCWYSVATRRARVLSVTYHGMTFDMRQRKIFVEVRRYDGCIHLTPAGGR